MAVSVVPWVIEGSVLTIWVVTPFLILGAFQFREGSIFTCSFAGRIIGGNLFPLTGRRTLTFSDVMMGYFIGIDWIGCFEEEDLVKEKGIKRFSMKTMGRE